MTYKCSILLVGLILSTGAFFCSKPKQTPSANQRADTSISAIQPDSIVEADESRLADNSVDKLDSSFTRTRGPITIGAHRFMKVFVRITRVRLANRLKGDWPESDTSFVVLDSLGTELFRLRAHTTLGGAQTDFDCFQFTIPTVGSSLARRSSVVPSNPGDGEDVQFLGLDSNGKIVPLTSVIPKITTEVVFLDSRNTVAPTFLDPASPYAKPAFQIQYWNGNFDVKAYYCIYPDGFIEGKHAEAFHFKRIPVVIDTSEARRKRGWNDPKNPTVYLCDKPSKDPICTNGVTVRVDSRINFLDAAYLDGWWLHVIIDGQEGYVRSWELVKLGLPDAG